MPRRQETVEIHRDPEAVFDLIHDYAQRLEWDPFLREARILGGAKEAARGVATRCVARNGMAMETVYVSFNRPHSAAVKMTSGPVIFGSFAATWRQGPVLDAFTNITAERDENGSRPGVTRVVYEYHLTGRPRWLRWIVDPLLCWVFSRESRRRLAALKKALER